MSKKTVCRMSVALVLGWTLMANASAGPTSMRISTDQHQVRIVSGRDEVLTYRSAPGAFKPYVKELYTPKGRNILLDSPADHVHHHGLMLAYRVEGTNFWEEVAQCGSQIQRPGVSIWSQTLERTSKAGFSCDIDWQAPNKQVVLQETRRIEACADAGHPVTLVTWTSRLQGGNADQAVRLAGDHYFGLGMRFVRAMDRAGDFSNARKDPGKVFRGDEILARGHWCVYQADLDGQDVTVAMFDHPENPRPVTWFTMKTPFAYLAATMNLHEEPLTLPAQQSLLLRYGVAVWDGRQPAQEIERVYRQWLAMRAQDGD